MSNKTKITAPKGTHDVLPSDIHIWQKIEQSMLKISSDYGYKEIRFPTFEHTELFNRGVGDTTDVVQKEMYTFFDKGDRSITLRPEGTASTVRSYIENGLSNLPLPAKLCYCVSCFRYERPQAGRFREFRQFGIENFGSSSPYTDAEIISLAINLLNSVGVKGLSLYVNTIGCPDCRNKYNKILQEFLNNNKESMCELCCERMNKNPLRVLDCKNKQCQDIIKDAPSISGVLCEDCKEHFDTLKAILSSIGIDYKVDTGLVRGLDYYTRTVFEIKSDDESTGSQSTVCGGGRYDGLVEQLGGDSTPGIGFSIGMERLVNILKAQNVEIENNSNPKVFFVSIGDSAKQVAFELTNLLRGNGVSAEFDHLGRSVKAQMKYADKIKAEYTMVIGDDEITSKSAQLKDMSNGEVKTVYFNEFEKAENYSKILK